MQKSYERIRREEGSGGVEETLRRHFTDEQAFPFPLARLAQPHEENIEPK